MSDELGKRIRLVLGLVMPAVVTGSLLLLALIQAIRYSDWGLIGSAAFLAVILLGPFLIYYVLLRTVEFSIAIGVLLLAAGAYGVAEMIVNMNRGSSTAGLSLLWLPLIGYPVVAIGAFLDRLSR